MFIEELLDYLPFQKVFEICVRKQVCLFDLFRADTYKDYNNLVLEDYELTEKEFNSIKGLAIYARSF